MKHHSLSKVLKRLACVLAALVIALAVAVFALWHNELATLSSLKKLSDRDEAHRDGAVYQLNVSGGYYFDDFLAQGGASTDSELISFITQSITKGIIPMNIKTSTIACSAFTADTQSGDRVFGRNYDFSATNTTTLLRLILDYADSVEDAVALAQQYDLHDSASSCFHYMVADSTGRSAVLEWVGADADHDADGSQRQLNVLWNDTDALSDSSDWQVVTNFIKAPGYYDGTAVEMKGLDRYEHLAAALRQTNGVVADKSAAMDLLASVGRRTWNNDDSNTNTIHSVVYDLTDRSVLWVGNEHYGEDGYTFEFQLGA